MADKLFFFVDPKNIVDSNFTLDKTESKHLLKVLRVKVGSEIWLTDGCGKSYRAIFKKSRNDIVSGKILDVLPQYGENALKISCAIGILKKNKMDLVVEKNTELGTTRIIPLILDRGIKLNVNVERLQKIAKAAIKQCGRSVIPEIFNPIKLADLLKTYENNNLIVCHDSGKPIDSQLLKSAKNNKEILLLIGPEGDFSNSEIMLLKKHDAKFINLGKRRLRSETAVVVALSLLNNILDN